MSRINIVLLGDSLTQFSFEVEHQGWGAALQSVYARKADVINRGYSGYNSTWVSALVPKIIPEIPWNVEYPERNLVTILLGANDSCEGNGGVQHVSLEKFKENIVSILDRIKQISEDIPILLITPPRVNETMWEGRNDEQVKKYADVIRALGKEHDRPVVDLWTDLDNNTNTNTNNSNTNIDSSVISSIVKEDLWDGLHFGTAANKKVFARIQQAIELHYHHLIPDQLEMHFPGWKELPSEEEEIGRAIQGWKWSHI